MQRTSQAVLTIKLGNGRSVQERYPDLDAANLALEDYKERLESESTLTTRDGFHIGPAEASIGTVEISTSAIAVQVIPVGRDDV